MPGPDKIMWTTPVPSSHFDTVFHQAVGSSVVVAFRYDGEESEQDGTLAFLGVRAFTWSIHEGIDHPLSIRAYSKLIDVGETLALRRIRDNGGAKDLKHLAIYFDGSGCYEAICTGFRFESVEVSEGAGEWQ